MSRILLVDDQKEVLDGLQTFLSNSMANAEILRAADGASGYETALRTMPDVIVVDVMMPGVDGLKMISLLKKDGIKSRVIILTAYERFDFAREAIALGVDDYLIKPVTQRQIYQAVMRQLSVGEQRRAHDLYSNVLLQEYLSGADIFLQQDAVMAMSGLSALENDGWMIGLYALNAAQRPENLAMLLVQLEQHFLRAHLTANLYHTYGKEIFAVVNMDLGREEQCARLLENIAQERLVACGGCSGLGIGLDSLCELYRQAEAAMESARKSGQGFQRYSLLDDGLQEGVLRELTQTLAEGNADAAWHIVDAVFARIVRGDDALERARRQCMLLLEAAATARGALGLAVETLEGAESMFTLRKAARSCIDCLAAQSGQRGCPPVIVEAMDYIRVHCNEALTVAFLANRANLSYAYFSTLFAHSVGMPVKRYLLNERLWLAGEMVRGDVALRIGDVAQRCGFDDVRYFSTCFKRRYGMTPQEWRAGKQC